MQWNTFLIFNGQCEAAFRFYAECFGGKIVTLLPWGGSPMADQAPSEWGGKILHATLEAGGNVLSGCDALPAQYEAQKGFKMQLNLSDPAETERIFGALGESGTVELPLQETLWATRYGHVVDRFGIPWAINCERAQLASQLPPDRAA
jgi:PhnB protein